MTNTLFVFEARDLEPALMPPAPVNEFLPLASDVDPDVYDILELLSEYHYAAFCTVYGLPPLGVSMPRIYCERDDRRGPQPLYAATIARDAAIVSQAWFEAFRAGLDRWDDAGFPDPLTMLQPPGSATIKVTITPAHTILRKAAQRLAAEAREDALRNLALVVSEPMIAAPRPPAFALPTLG